jgi:quinol monooxygenase YgiN
VYTIYVKFDCLPQKREAFIEKMRETGILAAIRGEDGCKKYDYYLSENHADELLLIEQWETKSHQQIHLTQPHMVQMREFKDDYIAKTTLGEVTLG